LGCAHNPEDLLLETDTRRVQAASEGETASEDKTAPEMGAMSNRREWGL